MITVRNLFFTMPVATNDTQVNIKKVLGSLETFLFEKNKRYGNSALYPLGIFSKDGAAGGLAVRADDKLSRIKNSDILRKNDVVDLMGYLTFICIENGWKDFADQQD